METPPIPIQNKMLSFLLIRQSIKKIMKKERKVGEAMLFTSSMCRLKEKKNDFNILCF